MKIGVVGLPNVGKSTLFNALTNAKAESANYPFCTIEPNVGIVTVKDDRLEKLASIYGSQRVLPAIIEFVDIAGLVKGASKGEGLGNKFLSHIREVDAIVHVVRCFDDENIISVSGETNPKRDAEIINLELILADLDTAAKRHERTAKLSKSGDKQALAEKALLERVIKGLEDGIPARALKLTPQEEEIVKGFFLITTKPVIYVANISENQIGKPNKHVEALAEVADAEGAEIIAISAKIEQELSSLGQEDASLFMQELGITQSGLDKLISASYSLLGLMSYITAGEKEVRAWTIKKGTKAPQAAGKIHSDFERGFIRAEVISYEELMQVGSIAAAKEKGKVRIEGKDYVFKDGDVVLFRFNV